MKQEVTKEQEELYYSNLAEEYKDKQLSQIEFKKEHLLILNEARDKLRKKISPKLTGTKIQHELITSINELDKLIRYLENPEKINKLRRMFE
jgi:phosphoglucomutase